MFPRPNAPGTVNETITQPPIAAEQIAKLPIPAEPGGREAITLPQKKKAMRTTNPPGAPDERERECERDYDRARASGRPLFFNVSRLFHFSHPYSQTPKKSPSPTPLLCCFGALCPQPRGYLSPYTNTRVDDTCSRSLLRYLSFSRSLFRANSVSKVGGTATHYAPGRPPLPPLKTTGAAAEATLRSARAAHTKSMHARTYPTLTEAITCVPSAIGDTARTWGSNNYLA